MHRSSTVPYFPSVPALFLYFVLIYYYYFLVYRKLPLITPPTYKPFQLNVNLPVNIKIHLYIRPLGISPLQANVENN